ncbi:hypothetical protein [Lysinibacillus odysseyi]|uniref:Uncharacterized protein n=1 Tax=Lysinibacillus odysseyi 34hs-1 = NBRC 100172 TaxID=1220589 RepID=A0A0A3IZS6_9BACI|nr:hypothetical protein [Lysinibacillus odysseyi]KGR88413.1 hypothetical protein CD32_01765 [Lysinibacillus odysseyi 34hs-1 = NBRC 100172]
MSNKDKLVNNALNLLELKKLNSTALFKESIKRNMKISKKRAIFLIFLFLFCFYVLFRIVFQKTPAISIISDLTVNVNTVIIPIFAVLITGYAIFQALANENTITNMLTVVNEGEDKISKFAIYNLYFFGVICSYLSLIIINFILLVVFKYLPADWSNPFFAETTNEIVAAILISMYVTVLINFMIEVKSYVYNLFQVFLTNAIESAITRVKSVEEKPHTAPAERTNRRLRKKGKRKR